MEKTIEFLQTHGEEILFIITGLYELAVRIWPTSKNLSIIDKVIKIISFIIPNRSTKTTFINVEGSDIKETSKHIIKMIVFFVLFSISIYAQTNVTGKSFRSYNADSLTVRTEVSGLQLMYGDIGALYYNKQSSKWRIFSDSTWSDLGTGGGGSGGAFWPLGGTGTLTSNVTIDGGTNQILLQNDYGSFTMDGLQTAVNGLGDLNLSASGNASFSATAALDILATNITLTGSTVLNAPTTNTFMSVAPSNVYISSVNAAGTKLFDGAFLNGDFDLLSTNNPGNRICRLQNDGSNLNIINTLAAGNSSSITLTNSGLSFRTGTTSAVNTRFSISPTGVLNSSSLSGVGTRMVTVSSSGDLGSAVISGITNTAAANEMAKSDGTNLVPSGVFSTSSGDLIFGSGALAGTNRSISAAGSGADVGFVITPKGAGNIFIQPNAGQVAITNTGTTGTTMLNLTSSGTSGSNFTFISGTNNPVFEGGGGSSFTVKGKDAAGGGNGIILKGGDATAGNTNGGNVTISGGALSGSGANGFIVLQNLPTSCVGVPTGGLANIAGVLNVCP